MEQVFSYSDGDLSAGSVRLADLAREYGTPLYVYHRPAIADRIEAVRAAFGSVPTHLCYSVKANSNLKLLRWLAGHELGFDVVSGGELERLDRVGVEPARIVFAGVGKTEAELRLALDRAIWMITAESVGEVDRIAALAAEAGRTGVPISLRMNPDVDAVTHPYTTTGRRQDKFGILIDELGDLLDRLTQTDVVSLVGLHMHLGSQITSVQPYREGMQLLMECLGEALDSGFQIRWLNTGGGFGIPYQGQAVPTAEQYAGAICPLLKNTGLELVLELGRYLLGEAGALITEVQYVKPRDGGDLVITDAGMTDLLRPALYQAHHAIRPLVEASDADRSPATVAGPICESSDVLGVDVPLPATAPGDLLAIMDAGAYGSAMASNYNSHLRPAEVWIAEGGAVELIRRRDSLDDLLRAEIDADGLSGN